MVGAELFTRVDADKPGYAYEFDGSTMYATMPDWKPLGLPFSVEVEAVPLTVDGTNHYLYGTSTMFARDEIGDQYRSRYLDVNDVSNSRSSGVLPVEGVTIKLEQSY